MGRCIIALQRHPLTSNKQGFFVFSYQEKYDLFLLSIVINENLYKDNSFDLKVQRKALVVHEFVHCVAAMMSLSLLGKGPNPLIKRLKEIIKEKVAVTTSDDFTKILKMLENIDTAESNGSSFLFNDTHFRTGFEDFPDDYAELYLNFLFSYQLLLEYLSDDENNIKSILKKTDEEFAGFMNGLIEKIAKEKALKIKFVISRIIKFLPRLVKELKLQ